MNEGLGLLLVIILVWVIPFTLAWLISRRDPCAYCGRAMIHTPDCKGHFDA